MQWGQSAVYKSVDPISLRHRHLSNIDCLKACVALFNLIFLVQLFKRNQCLQHSSLESFLLYLTDHPNAQKAREKIKDGIISGTKFLGTISVDLIALNQGILKGEVSLYC